jgi:hypothetical protein
MSKLIGAYLTSITHREEKLSHIFFGKSKRVEFCRAWRDNIKGDLKRSFRGDWLGSEISSVCV